jgi:phytoene dehydrogenase-like protein
MCSTLPGLKDFYLTGQWVEPGGGLQIVATSGRNIIRQICAEDKKEFITRPPC